MYSIKAATTVEKHKNNLGNGLESLLIAIEMFLES
jgi:hypothetical protein